MNKYRTTEPGFNMKKLCDAYALVGGPIAAFVYPIAGLTVAYYQIDPKEVPGQTTGCNESESAPRFVSMLQ